MNSHSLRGEQLCSRPHQRPALCRSSADLCRSRGARLPRPASYFRSPEAATQRSPTGARRSALTSAFLARISIAFGTVAANNAVAVAEKSFSRSVAVANRSREHGDVHSDDAATRRERVERRKPVLRLVRRRPGRIRRRRSQKGRQGLLCVDDAAGGVACDAQCLVMILSALLSYDPWNRPMANGQRNFRSPEAATQQLLIKYAMGLHTAPLAGGLLVGPVAPISVNFNHLLAYFADQSDTTHVPHQPTSVA